MFQRTTLGPVVWGRGPAWECSCAWRSSNRQSFALCCTCEHAEVTDSSLTSNSRSTVLHHSWLKQRLVCERLRIWIWLTWWRMCELWSHDNKKKQKQKNSKMNHIASFPSQHHGKNRRAGPVSLWKQYSWDADLHGNSGAGVVSQVMHASEQTSRARELFLMHSTFF